MTDWKKRYEKLIKYCRQKSYSADTYTEVHHIIPRSLGGLDTKENLIPLEARAHFLAHFILWKMHEGTEAGHKMVKAFTMMKAGHTGKRMLSPSASRLYHSAAKAKSIAMSKSQSGSGNSQYGTCWIHDTRGFKEPQYRNTYRITKGDPIPEHHALGRVLPASKWDGPGVGKEFWNCEKCGDKFTRPTYKGQKLRTKKCQKCIHTRSNRVTDSADDFIKFYKQTGSIHQACLSIGISYGAKGDMHRHGKNLLIERGIL